MKLNKESRDELRKSVEVLLKNSPKNKKIQLPKETLDLLLFDTYTCNQETGLKIKIPVWSGEFLQKLDLSQVDFEDVSWCMPWLMGDNCDCQVEHYEIFDKDFPKKLESLRFYSINEEKGYFVSYANTNAKIDLNKSFEAKNFKEKNKIIWWGCDFKNTDLSVSDFTQYKNFTAYFCDFSNTGIRFPQDIYINASDCNLSNNDLSYLEIDGTRIIIDGDDSREINFSNTGINIKLDVEKLTTAIEKDAFSKRYLPGYYKQCINELWIGCNLNGKKIKNQEEKKQTLEEMKTKYSEFKDEEFSKILGSVAEQINSSGHKR